MTSSYIQVVSLHCALDEKTKHLINKDRLNIMKKDAILVNAARGPVHDEVALVEHLKANPDFRSASSTVTDNRDLGQLPALWYAPHGSCWTGNAPLLLPSMQQDHFIGCTICMTWCKE